MEPVYTPGWKSDQRELAEWSDSSSASSSSSCNTTEDDESYGYYRLVQMKRSYTFILEEEELIE
jgi:hypothetical protein